MPETTTTNATAITRFQASENTALSSTLLGLENSLQSAARQNLEHVLATQNTNLQAFTDLEIAAMMATEELRLVNGMDLASLLLRGKIIADIEARALHTVHPNGFANLTELAQSVGISVSELSDIRTMCGTIFPWIEDTLGVPVAQIWENIGKTKFRMMVPVLSALITGEEPATQSARDNFNRILDTAAIELGVTGDDAHGAEVRNHAARALIETAGQETTRGFQEHIRDGNVTPAITPTIVNIDGHRYMIAEVNEEQMLVAARKLGRHMAAPDVVDLPREARARQREALRTPVLRAIYQAFEG